MLLSVVLPNFNHAKWLPRSVNALLSQSEPPDEIIIVDDASTDNSISVIEKLARDHKAIRLIRHATNLGAVTAMTTGFAAAKGEFVLFSAADDFVLPGLLQRALAALRKYPQAALFCAGVVMVDPQDKIVGFRPFTEPVWTARYVTPHEVRRLILTSDNWIIGPSVIYRRECLMAIGGFDPALGSFCDGIVVRNLALLHGFYFDPDILAICMVYPQSFSASSALSATKSRALIDIARERGVQALPEDIRDRYRDLIARRLRFSMSRLSLLFANGDPCADGVEDVFGGSATDRRVLQLLGRIPFVNPAATLSWMFLRARPFGVWSIITSWWRHMRRDPSRRAIASLLLAEMTSTASKKSEMSQGDGN